MFESSSSNEDRTWLNDDFKTSKAAVALCLKDLKTGGSDGDELPAGSILQIQSTTNVSVPIKSHTEFKHDYDPKNHILKFCLTDGKETVYGILYEPHLTLSSETPPGTKIKAIRGIPISSSRILKFTRGNVEVLGGYVEKLVENWRVQKEHDKKAVWGKLIVNSGEVGPPKFKPLSQFGNSAPVGNVMALRSAKAMDLLEAVKAKSDQSQLKPESKSEFDVQRQEAISDLVKQNPTNKKAFSTSKQFPNAEATSSSHLLRNEGRDRGSIDHSQDYGTREPPKPREPRFSSRKAKDEEEELLSDYTYRGNQLSLKDHFSDFFNKSAANTTQVSKDSHHKTPYHDHHRSNVDMDSTSSAFGRMGIDNSSSEYPTSQVFYRGGGGGGRGGGDSSQHFSSRGGGPRRSRGGGRGPGRGRGRGRGSYDDYDQQPPRNYASTYTPDPSSFPSLG